MVLFDDFGVVVILVVGDYVVFACLCVSVCLLLCVVCLLGLCVGWGGLVVILVFVGLLFIRCSGFDFV